MKLPSLFKKRETSTTTSTAIATAQPWQWPSCKIPTTISFRTGPGDDVFKTVNSVFFDNPEETSETPGSCFTNSSESASISTESEEYCTTAGGDSVEMIIRRARSERLFFEPGDTSSILESTSAAVEAPLLEILTFKESVALSMESEDPYEDFKKSMEEMVESHGLKDWDCLEELLGWYLRMNGKNNHEFIVGAFVDLLVGLASNSCSDSTSYSSAASTFSSPSYSPLSPVVSRKESDGKDKRVIP